LKFSYRRLQKAFSEEDETELQQLYLPCHEDLMLYCLGKFQNPELARDAASETLRMLLEHPDPAAIPNLKAWLLSVAKHVCLKVVTREERRRQLLLQHGQKLDSSREDGTDAQLDHHQLEGFVKDILSGRDYEIWKLESKGYKDREIAEKLSMNEKTVANRKSLIKKELKSKLKHFYPR